MGKKAKTGKARKDKFYQLAKETGYRSRAAFKLLQLNRKFEFLQGCRVCIDLCAAPGGWLQVAVQQMPVSSIVLGVDLVPIKSIKGVTTFQDDITTAKCRQALRNELKTWKADVVLHDGAPNVGQNWIHDAFQQAQLTLQALRLASEFLRAGGWFITKVFRSKDYHALLWVLKQLFKKVHATKPQASRNESAEIFVVCQGYLAPDKLDPRFTDPRHVFADVEGAPLGTLNLIHPEKVSKKAHGYAEGDRTLHHKVNVSQFLSSKNHLELICDCHELVFDDELIENHRLTTAELKECCKDIKVLGKKELRMLITWRKNMCQFLEAKAKKEQEGAGAKKSESEAGSDVSSEDEEQQLDNQLSEMKDAEMKDLKRKRKKVMKAKRKLRDKMGLNMIIPGDQIVMTDDVSLFNLKKLKSKQQLSALETDKTPDSDVEDFDDIDAPTKKQMMAYDRYSDRQLEDGDVYDDDDEPAIEMELDVDDQPQTNTNPLLVHFNSQKTRTDMKTDMWFNKDIFSGIDDEGNKDLKISNATETNQKMGSTIEGSPDDGDSGNASANENAEDDDDDDDESESSSSEDEEGVVQETLMSKKQIAQEKRAKKSGGFEVVPFEGMKAVKLNATELALGEELIKSSKRKRELVELSFHRFTTNDRNLPDWFSKDESRHCKKRMPVSKDQIAHYKEQQKLIDARPIKKVAEAKARKKKKAVRKLEKVRKKAETINEEEEVTDREKWKQIKDVYKRAGLLKKKKESVTYIVAKKGVGRRVSRPKGVKGRFKVVDPRMKKDEMKKKKSGGAKDGKHGKKGKSKKGAR